MIRYWLAFALCIAAVNCNGQLKRFAFTEPKMGSPFHIIFYCGDSTEASLLAQQSFALVDSFVQIFSDYIDTSELSKLSASSNQNAVPVNVSPAMLDILKASKLAFNKSNGAFDITIGPLVKLWRKARKSKNFPSRTTINTARQSTGFSKLIIDTSAKKITLTQAGMQLDLGGIAQGYIAQKIIDFLLGRNIGQALVNASGDIVISGAPPGTQGWVVGINVPETADELLPQTLLLQHMSVTTSGDVYQFMEHDGKRYSHIIDPRTGYGITSQKNVTAIAKDGTTADWLATACSILPVKKAKKLAASLHAEIMVAVFTKGKLVVHTTKGFTKYLQKKNENQW